MRVDWNDFLLVGRELFGIALEEGVSGVEREGLEAIEGNTFNAARTAWVLLTMPTTTEPCLTASCAYSTWKMRPCGELYFQSVQRCLTVPLLFAYKVTESLS